IDVARRQLPEPERDRERDETDRQIGPLPALAALRRRPLGTGAVVGEIGAVGHDLIDRGHAASLQPLFSLWPPCPARARGNGEPRAWAYAADARCAGATRRNADRSVPRRRCAASRTACPAFP